MTLGATDCAAPGTPASHSSCLSAVFLQQRVLEDRIDFHGGRIHQDSHHMSDNQYINVRRVEHHSSGRSTAGGFAWSSNHPPSQNTWVICEANCSSITLDTSIILLVCMVNGDGRKHSLGLLHCEVAIAEMPINFWVLLGQLNHVSQMYWYPASIVCVVQCMEPWSQFCQGVHIHGEVCLLQRPHKNKHTKF